MNIAVVLAARHERDASIPYPLRPFTENVCLIDRTLAILKENGFKRVYIVAGFCHKLFDKYASEEVSIIYNKDYEFTASMGSLALLKDYIDEDFLLIEGDTFFEKKVVEGICAVKKGNCISMTEESIIGYAGYTHHFTLKIADSVTVLCYLGYKTVLGLNITLIT